MRARASALEAHAGDVGLLTHDAQVGLLTQALSSSPQAPNAQDWHIADGPPPASGGGVDEHMPLVHAHVVPPQLPPVGPELDPTQQRLAHQPHWLRPVQLAQSRASTQGSPPPPSIGGVTPPSRGGVTPPSLGGVTPPSRGGGADVTQLA